MKYYSYSAIKKIEISLDATTWMDLEGITPSEINQRKAYHVISLTYEFQKTKQKQTYRYREQADGYQRGHGWGVGIITRRGRVHELWGQPELVLYPSSVTN